jgi:hypothetical protein
MRRSLFILAWTAVPLGCSSGSPATDPMDAGRESPTVIVPDAADGDGTGPVEIPDAAREVGPPSAEVVQACAGFSAALCAKLQACSPFAVGVLYGDVEMCKQRLALDCVPKLTAPGTSATVASLNGCAQALPAVSCATFAVGDFGLACAAKPGSLADGAACGDDAQCASTFCARAATAICGVCARTTRAGDACVRGACSAGTVCPMGQTTCIAPVAGKAGDACTTLEQCDVGNGVGCNTTNRRCIGLSLSSPGGTCGADSILATTYAVCPAGGACSAIVNGTCSSAAADGATCSTAATGPGCRAPARCVNSRCTLPDPPSCR